MLSINVLVRLALFILPVLASKELLPVKRAEGDVLEDSYIVLLNDGYKVSGLCDSMPGMESNITHQWSLLNGFAVNLSPSSLTQLRTMEGISYISENGAIQVAAKQTDAPWGLQRISHRERVTPNPTDKEPNYEYIYDRSGGDGVNIYVIDTGIEVEHPQFEGRAKWGFTSYVFKDGHGHGTHCAGTAASRKYGVSKKANLIAVKVFDDTGHGWWSDIITGIDWVADDAKKHGCPSVASMSFGGGVFPPVDDAVTMLIKSGVPSAVAAGNDAVDAELRSPARTPRAITVGATDINDDIAYFSDFGKRVDIFAPGVNVLSTWIGKSTNIVSGTSQATPHVSGFMAYLLGMDSSLSVGDIRRTIERQATRDAIHFTAAALAADTQNRLLYNDYHQHHRHW